MKIPGDRYKLVSFQVTIARGNEFGFIIFGKNLLTHDHSDAYENLRPGNRVKIECVQVKDKEGKRQVLDNRIFYIVAGPVTVNGPSTK